MLPRDQRRLIEQAKFTCSLLGKAMEKQEYWNILPPGAYFGLGVLKHFVLKICNDFELYQVFMYSFLC